MWQIVVNCFDLCQLRFRRSMWCLLPIYVQETGILWFSWTLLKMVFNQAISGVLIKNVIYHIVAKMKWKLFCCKNPLILGMLTLNVRGPSYLGLTRSISWLLMPWLLTSPGHQQPWYWLCRIGRFLSYLRKNFNYLHRINVEKWDKM